MKKYVIGLVFVSMVPWFLTSCGQNGPLYLPSPQTVHDFNVLPS